MLRFIDIYIKYIDQNSEKINKSLKIYYIQNITFDWTNYFT